MAVIPAAARASQSEPRAEPGSTSKSAQAQKWIPDRARVPDFKLSMGASGMTNSLYGQTKSAGVSPGASHLYVYG
ncbi:hypothetical protein GCM10008941_12860 [Rhizomicrobium palustre]